VTSPVDFQVEAIDPSSGARSGTLKLARDGRVKEVLTPVFMPVGTQAALRTVPPLFVEEIGIRILLANTYHLHQRPGEDLIDKMGGLHTFMNVDSAAILTDSGGFQVFSLKKKQVTEEGVSFAYEVDGKKTFLSPETSMDIQMKLGANIAMAFDECLPADADKGTVEESIELTARWAERSIAAHTRNDQSLFGIVQGGMFRELRRRSVSQITNLPFDGFAIGGLAVGEGPEIMNEVLAETTPLMPPELPRYLMGVGRPQDLVDGVARGVDMFDCVIPTRHARGGVLYTFQGRIRITHNRYRRDGYPPDSTCNCYTCSNFSRAYLFHLFSIGEVLGTTLATVHNLHFFQRLMERVRASIADGTFASLRNDIKALYPEKKDGVRPDTQAREAKREAQKRQADRGRESAREHANAGSSRPQPRGKHGGPRSGGKGGARGGDRSGGRPGGRPGGRGGGRSGRSGKRSGKGRGGR